MDDKQNPMCIKTACLEWQYKHKDNQAVANALCERCGFSKKEDALRKRIPLTLCDDGLRRKLIPPRHGVETEVEDDAGGNDDSEIEEEGDGDGEEEPGT